MLLKCFYCMSLMVMSVMLSSNSYAAQDHDEAWRSLRPIYFSDRPIHEDANTIVTIEVPQQVEDAAVVPITIKSLSAQTKENHIKTIHLIVDNNPQPYSAAFHLSPDLGPLVLSTRIRMDSYSNVRVIAEMNDSSLHMVDKFVIASGGCSAPSSKDAEALLATLGQIKIRMRKPVLGMPSTVQTLISHPNANGMQMNPHEGSYIPAHYVTQFDISYNDEMLIKAETGFTLSETPSIRFNFIPEQAGTLQVKVKDSKENVYTAEKLIN